MILFLRFLDNPITAPCMARYFYFMIDKQPIPRFLYVLLVCLVLSAGLAGYTYHLAHNHKKEIVPMAAYMNAVERSIRETTDAPAEQQSAEFKLEKFFLAYPFGRPNVFGDYLIGRFAQLHHDWAQASDVLDKNLKQNPENLQLMKRGMILSMGSGNPQRSLEIAHDIYKLEQDSSLVLLFLIAEAFHKKDYAKAKGLIKALPRGSVSEFILPLLHSWTDAAEGKLNIVALKNNAIHMYHAVLVSYFLKQDSEIDVLLMNAQKADDLSIYDLERIADIYAHIGKKDKALYHYQQIMAVHPQGLIQEKINALEDGTYKSGFEKVNSPQEGIAGAFYDMARALIDEYSDESARVFANIALFLDPNFTNAKILLAHITARNEQFSQAIEYYRSVNSDDAGYLNAQRKAADLLEDMGELEEAISDLSKLVETYKDIEAMIQIGDFYRRDDQFKKAISHYNQAYDAIMVSQTDAANLPEQYWHLYYVRGMSLERDGQWAKAEQDLETALIYRPDHPYLLNYLGYAWADQGVHLDKALAMIKRAVALRPDDGYITDSLGWVFYKLGQYEEAIEPLERAVGLLPYDPVVNDHLGDAYWQSGRKREARFQWRRALNYADDESELDLEALDRKIESGL